MTGMGIGGVLYGLSSEVGIAIVLVMVPDSSMRRHRSPAPSSSSETRPREMRGRVFSAFYVMRDVVFLFGMAERRPGRHRRHPGPDHLRVLAPVRVGRVHVRRTGPGGSRRGAPRPLDCARPRAAPALAASPVRAATLADFDLLAGRIGAFTTLSPDQRSVVRGGRPRSSTSPKGRASSSTATRRRPPTSSSTVRRPPASPTEDGYSGLSTMTEPVISSGRSAP